MAVKLRLMRMGKKKQPTYRLVAADSRSPRDGRFIEAVGVYAPRGRSSADRDAVVQIDEVKVIRWLSDGAKPTDRVERILQQLGTLDRFRSGEAPRTDAVTAGGAAPGSRPAPTTEAAAPAAEPVAAEPVAAEPVAAEPVAAEPVAAEAPATEAPATEAPVADGGVAEAAAATEEAEAAATGDES